MQPTHLTYLPQELSIPTHSDLLLQTKDCIRCTTHTELLTKLKFYHDSIQLILSYSSLSLTDYNFFKELKKINIYPQTILLTTSTSLKNIQKFTNLGIHIIHTAPFNLSLIRMDIKKYSSPSNKEERLSFALKHTYDIDLFTHLCSLKNINPASFNSQLNTSKAPTPKILIIEDEKKLNRSLNMFLTKEGFQCTSVYDWSGCTELFETNSNFDIILLDIGLPQITGDILISKLKKYCPYSQVIMLTAFKEEELLLNCAQKGAINYITKPFKTTELLKCIHKAIQFNHFKKITDTH